MKLFILLATLFSCLAKGQTLEEALAPKAQVQADLVHKMRLNGKSIEGQGITIAVLDSGVNYLQQDLIGKTAINKNEIKDDKIDNDHNGYIDDSRGWNFFHNNGIVIDDHGHGTHVSATIVANQYGIAPKSTILPVKVTINPEGQYSDNYLIKGIRYAADNGAKIINLSLRGVYSNMPVTIYALKEAVKYAKTRNVLLVVAAGNDSLDITNLPIYPATIESDNLITVCAVDSNFRLANFSNYSKKFVDICAPGVDIVSANKKYDPIVNPKISPYISMSGTSMATPIVSAVAALIWSAQPSLNAQEVKNIILQSSLRRKHLTPWLDSTSQTGAVINAFDAIRELKIRNLYFK